MTSATFWTGIARRYAADPVRNLENYEDTLTRSVSYLSRRDHLLELGCGTGPTALRLAPVVGRVVATDYADGMIEIARERLARAPAPNLSFQVATIGEACARGPFDAVAAFNLLHLLPDLDQALADIHAALRPGGTFLSKSACLAQPVPLLWPMVAAMQAMGKAPYVRFFSASGLQRRLEAAGFVILERHVYRGIPPTVFFAAQKPI